MRDEFERARHMTLAQWRARARERALSALALALWLADDIHEDDTVRNAAIRSLHLIHTKTSTVTLYHLLQ
jgi:hypothetical protein